MHYDDDDEGPVYRLSNASLNHNGHLLRAYKGLTGSVQPRQAAGDGRTTRLDDIDRRFRSSIYTSCSQPQTDVYRMYACMRRLRDGQTANLDPYADSYSDVTLNSETRLEHLLTVS